MVWLRLKQLAGRWAAQPEREASAPVPADGLPVPVYFQFATSTYDGYRRHGGVDGLGAIANPAQAAWRSARALPTTVDGLQAALFFEARRWHHYGFSPDEDAEAYIRALIAELRRLTGGAVRVQDN